MRRELCFLMAALGAAGCEPAATAIPFTGSDGGEPIGISLPEAEAPAEGQTEPDPRTPEEPVDLVRIAGPIPVSSDGHQVQPSTAVRPAGFLVAWRSGEYDEAPIRARLFDPVGTPTSPDRDLSGGQGIDTRPLAAVADEGYVVAWWRDESTVVARRVSATGLPSGLEIPTPSESAEQSNHVVAGHEGGWWLGWTQVEAGGQRPIRMARFQGDALQATAAPIPGRAAPVVLGSVAGEGLALVYRTDGATPNLRARLLDDDGAPLGNASVLLSGQPGAAERGAAVADLGSGRWAIAFGTAQGMFFAPMQGAEPAGPPATITTLQGEHPTLTGVGGRALVGWEEGGTGVIRLQELDQWSVSESNPVIQTVSEDPRSPRVGAMGARVVFVYSAAPTGGRTSWIELYE